MNGAPAVVDHHEAAAIEAAVRDYFGGWFEGDALVWNEPFIRGW